MLIGTSLIGVSLSIFEKLGNMVRIDLSTLHCFAGDDKTRKRGPFDPLFLVL